jgi:hypothetical protein
MMLFLCSLGPKPAFLGRQILYRPPYAWLMRLSVFGESVRVPARFAMLVAMTLSMAAALAYARLIRRRPSTVLVAAAMAAAILADSWTRPLPLFAPPAAWPSEVSTAGVRAFVELPLGETSHDTAAMYRSTLSGLPTANGYSGYFPAHYEALHLALEERDETALDTLAAAGPLLVVVERAWPYSNERLVWLRGNARARQVAENADDVWFRVVAPPRATTGCGSSTLPIAALADTWGPADLPPVTDSNDETFWSTGESQQVGDLLILDLGRVAQPCSVRLSLGSHVRSFPRMLSVSTSADGSSWQTSFIGKLGGEAVASALEHPRAAVLELPVTGQPARFIRLRVEAEQPEIAWIVTELAVTSR